MWLVNSITPDHGTIAGFVQKKKMHFIMYCVADSHAKRLGLIDGQLIAIDGTKIRAQNSRHNCITQSGLDKKIEYADAQINAYLMAIEKDDTDNKDFKSKLQMYKVRNNKKTFD